MNKSLKSGTYLEEKVQFLGGMEPTAYQASSSSEIIPIGFCFEDIG
jgi:hypothetical protein